ncbi:hypothetical protein [Candidatus Enterococcus clewellii]|uniref:Integral membrane protein n=1 Tax=Candidatus Enterococcus clewellii TaxID=1834193 RepID=A0A242KD25_9ENTE|nr:hypothetical protein [Enterococcus sp. 9E7_DIV0242]OTP19071.1 hypothetical protein A5888_000885 [Enterococcus sp. 9E7_DIV0242]
MIITLIGSTLLGLVAALYALLALGFPLGEFAMGGADRIMPKKKRIACALSIPIQLFAALVLLQAGGHLSIGLPSTVAKNICIGFGIYFGFNVSMNLMSKNNKERFVMTPLAAITAFSLLYTAFQM